MRQPAEGRLRKGPIPRQDRRRAQRRSKRMQPAGTVLWDHSAFLITHETVWSRRAACSDEPLSLRKSRAATRGNRGDLKSFNKTLPVRASNYKGPTCVLMHAVINFEGSKLPFIIWAGQDSDQCIRDC